MLLPMAMVFCLSLGLMGSLADPDTFAPRPVTADAGAAGALPADLASLPRGGIQHWRTTYYFATHIPEVCWGDNALNDFQKGQCGEFWKHLEMSLVLSLLPFALAFVFWKLALRSLEKVHRTARKQIEIGKPKSRGIATDPVDASHDLFSRVYCLRPIGVQLPGGKQIKAYIPLDAPAPEPGHMLAVFEPFQAFGERRHFAVTYAPHVAVVSGIRRA
jgi:hypothetical protein